MIFEFLQGMEWYMVSLFLGLFALGLAVPLRVLLIFTGFTRKPKKHFFVLINPVVEEVVFRVVVLAVTVALFGFFEGIIAMTLMYMIYMGFMHGPPAIADGLVIGILFSLAFFEFGFLVVLLAHMIYRFVIVIW